MFPYDKEDAIPAGMFSTLFMGSVNNKADRQIPPAPYTPPSATDPTNQKGDESLLGTTDSAAAHRSKAEQAEEQAFEARSILQAFTTRLVFVSFPFLASLSGWS